MNSKKTSDDRKRIKVAASNGQLEDVIILATKFSDDVTLLNETLIVSCVRGHLDVVKWMVEHTAADVTYSGVIKARYAWGEEGDHYVTPLTAACDYKHLDVVKYLVETSRIDVNLPDSERGYTPLIAACVSGSVSEAMYLLSEVTDLDVNIANRHGNTALHYAVSSNKNSGHTQLHKACTKGDVTEVIRLVCVYDHIINVQANGGDTPLHYACRLGHSDIVKTLMFWGADETITDCNWLTPAQLAERKGRRDLLKLLDRVTLWKEMQKNIFNNSSVNHNKLTKTKHTCIIN